MRSIYQDMALSKAGKRNALAVCLVLTAVLPFAVTQSDPVPVTGALTAIDLITGEAPARQNIDDLFSRGDPQWDLYVLALSTLQNAKESDELSYYQIAGIHGLPYMPWNGAEQVRGGPLTGFCPHGDLLFATWHRPYLALLEQVLVSTAQDIARQYPNKLLPTYQAAAQSLRLAYWDWGLRAELPMAVTLANVTINSPSGKRSIVNPFYNYKFQQLPTGNGFGGYLARYTRTLRCPNASLDNDAALSNALLDANSMNATNDIYDTFTRSQTFEAMAYIGSTGPSFENPHNGVHNWVSCPNGTMSELDWSAFDPLFFLHHANVDRLIALWQAVHYNNSMFNISGTSTGQFGTAPGTVITADSPLKPFFSSEGTFHTSSSVRDTRTLGYTYPELVHSAAMRPEELASSIRAQVNMLYGDDAVLSGRGATTQVSGIESITAGENKYYTAEIQADRAELEVPCAVNLVVLGRTIASLSLLSMPTTGMAFASVALKAWLPSFPIEDRGSESVVPFLQQHVRVSISKRDGTTTPVKDVPSLKVQIQALDYVPRGGQDDFPRFGKATKWPVVAKDDC